MKNRDRIATRIATDLRQGWRVEEVTLTQGVNENSVPLLFFSAFRDPYHALTVKVLHGTGRVLRPLFALIANRTNRLPIKLPESPFVSPLPRCRDLRSSVWRRDL
jgi:hypothetical protein